MVRVAGIIRESVVDGKGIRLALFVQGCKRHCPGCHNEHTWDPNGGTEYSEDEIIKLYAANPLLDGITFSGGEPLLQAKALTKIAMIVNRLGGNVWLFTGYQIEEVRDGKAPAGSEELLRWVNVLVDGPFVLAKRNLELKFRGSSNQRIWSLPGGGKDWGDYQELEL